MHELEHEFSQRYIVEPLNSNIHIDDLFYLIDAWETTKYSDDIVLYTSSEITGYVISSFKVYSKLPFKWF